MSNYINSLSSVNRYTYTGTVNGHSKYNSAPLVYGKRTASDNYVNSTGIQNLTGITANAKSLSGKLEELSKSDAYNRYNVTSSNTEALAVSSSSQPKSDFAAIEVDIMQLATAQTNKGGALAANDAFGSHGTQQFEISVGGKAHQFSVKVEAGDTNRMVQQKMAAAINNKNIGVTASVSQNATDKTSTLNISGNNTGDDAKYQFNIRDMSGTLVAKTGASNVERQAQDAIYTVNGSMKTSKSNVVDLGNGVTATLKKETETTATVSAQKDNSYAVGKAKEMVESFNKLWSAAQSTSATNDRLYNDLSAVLKSYGPALERIGINVGKDGSLSVNQSVLQAASEVKSGASKSELETFMTQSGSYGFTTRVARIADSANKNPAYYAGSVTGSYQIGSSTLDAWNTVSESGDIFTMLNNNASYMKAYNKYMSMGFLFDMFA